MFIYFWNLINLNWFLSKYSYWNWSLQDISISHSVITNSISFQVLKLFISSVTVCEGINLTEILQVVSIETSITNGSQVLKIESVSVEISQAEIFQVLQVIETSFVDVSKIHQCWNWNGEISSSFLSHMSSFGLAYLSSIDVSCEHVSLLESTWSKVNSISIDLVVIPSACSWDSSWTLSKIECHNIYILFINYIKSFIKRNKKFTKNLIRMINKYFNIY